MKRFSLINLFLLFFIASSAQNLDMWRTGSAGELKGKIYILSVFITTHEKKWSYQDKLEMLAQQFKAQDWLVSEAKRYGTDISFENGFYGVKSDLYVDTIKNIKSSYEVRMDWVNRILTQVGYSSPLEFLDRLKITKDCTNALVIIYANENGRSYAVPYNRNKNKLKYFFEGCMVYRYNRGSSLCPSTIAHEILHLFGAWDLYYEKGRYDKNKANKAWELYPKDIMVSHSCDIDQATIDQLTAWLVGLQKYKDKTFDWFRPDYQPSE